MNQILLVVAVTFALILLANWVETKDNGLLRRLFNWLLLLLNLPVFFIGLLFLLAPRDIMAQAIEVEGATLNLDAFGAWLVIMALWGSASALPEFRRVLSRLLKSLRPSSAVHATALLLAGYLVGNTLVTFSQGGLEGILLTTPDASIWELLAPQPMFVLAALLGVGFLVRRRIPEVVSRLGLARPTGREILIGTGAIVLLVAVQGLIGYIWSLVNPEQAALAEEIGVSLMGGFDTVLEWLLLATATGIGEELLFRGALQPVFGLGATSLVFALSHVQYGLTPATLIVLLLAIVLGIVRRRSNTTVCIYVHGGYNFTLGMLVLLASYAQQLAP